MDGKWLDNSDGLTVYCGGECEFKVWDIVHVLSSTQFSSLKY